MMLFFLDLLVTIAKFIENLLYDRSYSGHLRSISSFDNTTEDEF